MQNWAEGIAVELAGRKLAAQICVQDRNLASPGNGGRVNREQRKNRALPSSPIGTESILNTIQREIWPKKTRL